MKKTRNLLEISQKALKSILYNPETGIISWMPKDLSEKDSARWNSRYANKPAGTLTDKGYIRVFIKNNGKAYHIMAHQIAWFISNGSIPLGEIDHINQNRADNRIINLRDVSRKINHRNKKRSRNNLSGITGVYWNKHRNKWYAQYFEDGKRHHVGSFNNKKDAEIEIIKARELAGFTKRHGSDFDMKMNLGDENGN